MMERLYYMLRKVYRLLRRRPDNQQPCVWQTVVEGPLKGIAFFLPRGGERSWSGRILHGTYEPEFMEAMAPAASGGGILYDIGGHIGFFTCAWLVLGGRLVEVFEPVPVNQQIIDQTVKKNNFTEMVRLHRVALGAFNGVGTLKVNSGNIGSTSMSYVEGLGGIDGLKTHYQDYSSLNVDIRRLDDIALQMKLMPPTMLKLDVEGAEDAVLKGANDLLKRYKPLILVEIHNIDSGIKITEQLIQLRYSVKLLGKNQAGMTMCLWSPI